MKSSWRPSVETLGGFPAIENSASNELALSGKYGEIWESGPGRYRAVITNRRVARNNLPQAQWPVLPGDETLVSFGAEALPKWVKILKIPREHTKQEAYASAIGKNPPVQRGSGV